MTNAIRQTHADGDLVLPASIAAHAAALDLLLARSCKTDWHAYVKPPFGGPEHVLGYLAAYTHRIAISNRRILAFDGERVTFCWRDYADGNAQKTMTLDVVEFLRRFLMHVVPPRFVRIRYYGFLANRHRCEQVKQARTLIGSQRKVSPRNQSQLRRCPSCAKGTMILVALVPRQGNRIWFDTS